jgi:hypothetical protein
MASPQSYIGYGSWMASKAKDASDAMVSARESAPLFPATNRRTLIPSSPTRGIHHELSRAHLPLATAH